MVLSEVSKSGRVVSVDGSTALVSIDCDTSACTGCKVAAVCGSRTQPAIRADVAPGVTVACGDEVMVVVRLRNVLVSWAILAGLPVLAILIGVGIGAWLDLSEAGVGLTALALLALYYAVMWVLRGRIEHRVQWTITQIISQPD